MKKRWLFVTLLVGALALGVTGGTVLAQESGTEGGSPMKSFAARVAAILGVDEANVQDAFRQATQEMQDEALQRKLERMVENGRLTQEQADQIRAWYQSRPEVLPPGMPFGRFGGHHGHHRGGMWRGGGWHMPVPPTAIPTPGSSSTTSL